MSTQKVVIEIVNAKIEISISVKEDENKQDPYKTPERKKTETIIIPDAPNKRRKIVKYPFDILPLDFD